MTLALSTWTAASGQKIYGGMAPPPPTGGVTVTTPGASVDIMTILPAPGYLKSIHANSLESVAAPSGWQTESSGQNGPWSNWCGSVFAKDYSQYGAEVYFGGGHGGYDGNEFYIFDITTQKWLRLNDVPPTSWTMQTSVDWTDAEIPAGSGNLMMPASHTYSMPVYISAAEGGGPKGSWCLPFIVYGGGPTEGAGTSGFRPHAVDLATGGWTRYTDNTANSPYVYGAYGGCFVDTQRHVIWGLAGSESNAVGKIDLTANPKHVNLVNLTSGGGGTIYAVPRYIPELDKMVQVSIYEDGQRKISLTMYDMVGGVPTGYSISNDPAGSFPRFAAPISATHGAGIGIDYCPDTGKFYCFEGFGTNVLYVATPPGTPGDTSQWKTGVWTWTTETMLGETSASVIEVQPGAQGAQVFTKWKYHRQTKCFTWSNGLAVRVSPDGLSRAGAFQLYRPLGT